MARAARAWVEVRAEGGRGAARAAATREVAAVDSREVSEGTAGGAARAAAATRSTRSRGRYSSAWQDSGRSCPYPAIRLGMRGWLVAVGQAEAVGAVEDPKRLVCKSC